MKNQLPKKEPRFTFFNGGTPYEFKAFRQVYDPNAKARRSLFDMHRDMVRELNRPDVYILDHNGIMVTV